MVNPGENAHMKCVVDANPITEDTVKWTREGFDMEGRAKLTNVSSSSFFLTVVNVTEKDAGKFSCQVNNGIGEAVSNTTFLLVRRKYFYPACPLCFRYPLRVKSEGWEVYMTYCSMAPGSDSDYCPMLTL